MPEKPNGKTLTVTREHSTNLFELGARMGQTGQINRRTRRVMLPIRRPIIISIFMLNVSKEIL